MKNKKIILLCIMTLLSFAACSNPGADGKKTAQLKCEYNKLKNSSDSEAKTKAAKNDAEMGDLYFKNHRPDNQKASVEFDIALEKEMANCPK